MEWGQPTNGSAAQRHSSQSHGFAVRLSPAVVELVRTNLAPDFPLFHGGNNMSPLSTNENFRSCIFHLFDNTYKRNLSGRDIANNRVDRYLWSRDNWEDERGDPGHPERVPEGGGGHQQGHQQAQHHHQQQQQQQCQQQHQQEQYCQERSELQINLPV